MVSPATLWQTLRIYFKTVVLEVSVNKCQTEETYLWFETPCYYRSFAAMPVEIPLLCLPLFPFSFFFFRGKLDFGKTLVSLLLLLQLSLPGQLGWSKLDVAFKWHW